VVYSGKWLPKFGPAYWAHLQGLSSPNFGIISTCMGKHLETPHSVGIKLG
jgi:hypothetical protein